MIFFTYYKDIVSYKKSPPKTLDSRMVFSRVHVGLRSYNGTVVQMRFLYAYFYFMMYLGMRKRKIKAIGQVNDAVINAKMESKTGRMKKLVQLTMHTGRGVPRKAKKTKRLNLNSRHFDSKV